MSARSFTGAGALFAGLVAVCAAMAWQGAESNSLAAARAESAVVQRGLGARVEPSVAVPAAVEDVVARTRREIALTAGLAVCAGLVGVLALAAAERRRRAAESALRDERAQRETLESMGRIAAAMAHEIRGPLDAVSRDAQLLEREARLAPPARITELTRSIRAAATRADAVVRDALASEVGSLRTPPSRAPIVVAGDARLLARAALWTSTAARARGGSRGRRSGASAGP